MTFRAKTRTSQVNHTDAYRRITLLQNSAEAWPEQFNGPDRETKKERTDTLIQNAPIANCLPTGSTADRIAEQFNVSGRAEARLHIVCLPADPARDHVLIPRENAGRRIDDMSRANDHITPDK